jgi:hypothetical protein
MIYVAVGNRRQSFSRSWACLARNGLAEIKFICIFGVMELRRSVSLVCKEVEVVVETKMSIWFIEGNLSRKGTGLYVDR